jgi:hypothetical protein
MLAVLGEMQVVLQIVRYRTKLDKASDLVLTPASDDNLYMYALRQQGNVVIPISSARVGRCKSEGDVAVTAALLVQGLRDAGIPARCDETEPGD